MKFIPLAIPEVILIEPKIFADDRGFFFEIRQQQKFADAGIAAPFVQDNQSYSKAHVLRGLHYQIQQPQGKLVRVINGAIWDVAVDLRKNSPTFGRWVAAELSSENRHLLWVPPGFAHGFYVQSPIAEVIYSCTDFYAPQFERTLIWNDAKLNIPWPVPKGMSPVVSSKDAEGKSFAAAEYYS